MAFRGRKIADIYAELHLDRDGARAALRGVPAAMGADADRAGRELGKKVTDGLARAVEQGAARVAKARRAEVDAANAVSVAELRLKEAREKGNRTGSQLLALEHALEKAQWRLAESNRAATLAVTKHADAERRLAGEMDRVARTSGPGAERAGRELGGKLSQGIHLSIVRNSPLIAAAVGAALTAGAPVALASATVLFGGIGAVAAAQSDEVQSAWLGTWQQIKKVAVDAAADTVPVFVGMADRVSAGFTRMGPQIERAFEGAAPLLDDLVDSLLDAADNAMPGLVDAIERGRPVIEGLGDFVEDLGTGLSDFFSILAEHGDASGEVFDQLGDTMATLLPLLAELLGQGAELASDVLPLVNSSLGLVLEVTEALGPALPIVAAGFGAMKIAQTATGWLGGLATKLGTVAANGGAFSGVAGRMSSGLGSIAAAAGPVGAAIGFMAAEAYAWTEAGEKAADVSIALGRAFEVGGRQAAAAAGYLERFNGVNALLNTGVGEAVGSISFLGYSLSDLVPDVEQASSAYDQWVSSLDAGGRAAEAVRVAESALADAVERHGPTSREAAAASDDLAAAQAEVARIAGEEEMAIRGVTEAMLAQTDAVLAAANSDLAHRQAMDAANDSFAALNEAIRDYGSSSEEARDAALAFEGDLLRVVAAAGRLAEDALPANMDASQKLALSQLAQLDRLRELEAQYGNALPGALREMIAELERATSGYDRAALEAAALEAGTKNAKSAMEGLSGFRAEPTIDADDNPFAGKKAKASADLATLDRGRATPTFDADDKALRVKTDGALAGLRNLAAQRPTPTAGMNASPFAGVHATAMAQISSLGRQTPTPRAQLDKRSFDGTFSVLWGLMSMVGNRVVYPRAYLQADWRAADALMNYAARTRYSYVYQFVVSGGKKDGGPIYASTGRKVVGPGGPRDDLVPAVGPSGVPYRLSAGEWIINAMASAMQGDTKMRALNEGRARIVMDDRRDQARGFAGGGSPAPAGGGSTITVQNLTVTFPTGTAFDIRDPRELRRMAQTIRDELVKLEREQS